MVLYSTCIFLLKPRKIFRLSNIIIKPYLHTYYVGKYILCVYEMLVSCA